MDFYTEVKDALTHYWDMHGTRILGIVGGVVSALQLVDPSLLVQVVGARGVALLAVVAGILVYARGRVNAKNLGQ